MSMQDESRRQSHSGLVFDQRVAASVTLAGMLGVVLTSALFALSHPWKADLPVAQTAARASMPETSPSGPIRVVGATSRMELPCEQQTWPHIDRRCLTRVEAKPVTAGTAAATQDVASLSPLTATGGPVVPAPQSAPGEEETASEQGTAPQQAKPSQQAPAARQSAPATTTPRNDAAAQSALGKRDATDASARLEVVIEDDEDDAAEDIPPRRVVEPARQRRVYRYRRDSVRHFFPVPLRGFFRQF